MKSSSLARQEGTSGRKLLLATGILDIMPDLPGFAECWGRSVLHCPYCHGYEVHSESLGILANGEVGYEMATLIQHWSRRLTLFTNGPATLTADQREVLHQLNISIIETPVTAIEHEAGLLKSLLLADDSRVELKAVFSRVPFRLHTDIATQVGCTLNDNGLVEVTDFGETDILGLFAAGDATTLFRQVVIAAAQGTKVGAWMNRELVAEDLQRKIQSQSTLQAS